MWSSPNFGLLMARLGFGRDPQPSHVELVRQMLAECSPETRLEAPRALIGLDSPRSSRACRIPDARRRGDRRPAHAAGPGARASRACIPDSRLEVFPGGGHMLMLERADELDRLIVEFAHEVVGTKPAARVAR